MKSRQSGFTLIEATGAMLIGSMMLIGLTAMIDSSMEDSKGQQAAFYQSQVVSATAKYINVFDNYNALTTILAPSSGLTNTVIPLSNLRLPATMAGANIYGQTPCVVVKLRAGTLNKLDVLVVTTGGDKIATKDIAAVAAEAGPGNGYILDAGTGTTQAQGASWALDATALGSFAGSCLTGTTDDSGHLASALFFDSPGQLSTDFLYRNQIPGRPELNTMNTPMRMANNAVVVAGDTCPAAAIAVDANRELLQCGSDGKWAYVSKWKAPVADYTALNSLATKQIGDVRMALNIKKAFMYDGTKWVALAEDENGNLNITNHLAVGDVSGLPGTAGPGDIRIGGSLLANHDVTANQEVHAGWVIVDTSVTAESLFINYNSIGHYNGWACNITLFDRGGNPYKAWPVGSITAEGGNGLQTDGAGNPSIGLPNAGSGVNTGKTLYCGNDQVWHYISP
ncbi:shufflon system plasmid conjugative transfer pilus tip adhesin PilV [Undibacterium sp. SXout7W]|uniref:shufflon system plasmid conjugative transfer pilus tip adhesin PilV n=1 Tax=Undibacterium sp. SXout7W TaxID=3413049 RepID=UPI003BF26902